jgi:hypothetical protein
MLRVRLSLMLCFFSATLFAQANFQTKELKPTNPLDIASQHVDFFNFTMNRNELFSEINRD